jgi:glycerol kinase
MRLDIRIFFLCYQFYKQMGSFMSGLATGFWSDIEEIKTLYRSDRTFAPPQMIFEENDKLYAGWKKAVERTRM